MQQHTQIRCLEIKEMKSWNEAFQALTTAPAMVGWPNRVVFFEPTSRTLSRVTVSPISTLAILSATITSSLRRTTAKSSVNEKKCNEKYLQLWLYAEFLTFLPQQKCSLMLLASILHHWARTGVEWWTTPARQLSQSPRLSSPPRGSAPCFLFLELPVKTNFLA